MTQVVNTDFDGDKKFKVALWTGVGYCLQEFEVYAFNEEHALECVLAFCEKTGGTRSVYHRRANKRRPYRRRKGRAIFIHRPYDGR